MAATTNHNTGTAGEGGSAMDFANITPGTLPVGTVTAFGAIVATSYTAYQVESGEWIAFGRVHGAPKPVMPLVAGITPEMVELAAAMRPLMPERAAWR